MVTISEQVRQWILAYIDEHKFSTSMKIPSENALCRKFGLSRETIRAAIGKLAEENLVYRVKGSGTYINKEIVLSREQNMGDAPYKIGLILQGQDRDANAALIQGIKSVLLPDKVDICIFFTDNKFANERRCLQIVIHQNFYGFIIDGVKASLMNPNLNYYKMLYQKKIPAIFYNNYYKNLQYPKIIVDDFKCADRLMSILFKAGHRKIAGIFVYDNYQSVEKFQGMVAAMQKYGIEYQDDYVKYCVSSEIYDPKYPRSITRIIKSLPKCTAVVCCNYMILQLVQQVLHDMKKTVPQDISLVCFDYSKADWDEIGITCSVHQGYKIGCQAAVRLMRMIEAKEFQDNSYSYMVEPVIYEGRSVRNLNYTS
jgi:GntR family transcriptional regulator of arabinose operon